MDKKSEEISVKFTGGKDSTLTAFLMCKEFKRIHLLTFTHYLTTHSERAKVNAIKLKDIFGEDRIVHETIDIDDLYKKILTSEYLNNLIKYKTFLAACVGCGACKLAMHTRTIIYNIENNIKFTCDGINQTGFDQSQQRWIMEEIKKFYKEYDINYFCPVYDIPRTDLELFKLGLLSDKPTFFYGEQPGCYGSNFHNIYLRCYYLPVYGREKYEKVSLRYWREKMDVCRKFIKEYLR